MEVPTYEMFISDELVDGVFAVSLVDNPAILTDYVLLSKEDKIQIELQLEKLVDQKRKVICGPGLIPDMIIPRKDYNIKFSADTIRKISENFIINNYKDNVTLQHKVNVNKVYLVESWIVEDPKNDKAATLGFDVPKGTWMLSLKVNDDALWSEYIESGVLKGFSIEGNFSKEEVKLELTDDIISVNDLYIVDVILALAAKSKQTFTKHELNDFYVWKIGANEEHCPSCNKLAGKVKRLKDWVNLAVPRYQTGESLADGTLTTKFNYTRSKTNPKSSGPVFSTYCEDACQCELVKIISRGVNPYYK